MPFVPTDLRRKLRFGALALLACTAGATTAVTTASGHEDDAGATTTGTITTTSTTGTSTTGTTTVARAPRIGEIEVESLSGGRLRLSAEVTPRGASVTSVKIRYRGVIYEATRTVGRKWSRTVAARAGDRNDSVITLRVTACAGTRCASKTSSDDA